MVEEMVDEMVDETTGVRSTPPPPAAPPPPPPPPGLLPRRPARRSLLWVAVGSIVAMALLAFSTFQIVDVLAHEEHDRSWTVTEPVTTLVVDQSGDGSVHVIGAPVDEVTIRARISDGLRPTAHGHRVVGERLEVTASCPNFGGVWCSVDYEIEVPHDTVVQIHNDDGTRVENIAGDVDVRSSGSVDLAVLSGLVQVSTENGSVRASGMRSPVVEADADNGSVWITSEVPPRSVIATSDNGSVEVLVPRTDHRYSVDTDTDNGTSTNEVVTDPMSDRRLTARTSNGSVRVAYAGS